MASPEELSDMIKRLQIQLKAAEEKNAQLETSRTTVHVSSSKDRKVTNFSKSQDIDEWIQSVQLYLNNRSFSEAEKVSYIIDHLDEDTKVEIRMKIDCRKSTTSELFSVMRDIYSVKESVFELQQMLFSRDQRDSETLTDYSHVLMKLLFNLQKKSPETYSKSEEILKQRFAEGVRELSLKRELKRITRETPELSFFQVRDLAIAWEKDTNMSSSESTRFDSLLNTVQQQQQQIESLTETIKQQAEAVQQTVYGRGQPRGRYRGRGRGRGRGSYNRGYQGQSTDNAANATNTANGNSGNDVETNTVICHYCSQPNHIAPNCWKRKQDRKRQQQSTNSNHSS